MLQVKNIHKEYKVADMVQVALNDVSLAFRDSEFVAILGPSGSGKTTLLNILGGLDRYDSGDLIIDNISTRQYKDRDWDSYRNHSVGFIFQSYNLIPHQSLLSNVELALTISGRPSGERKQLAYEALEKVGLKDHVTKKPNMISGGQAQRVSIARALVNNPKIVLADEPTGALDSKTSVEIMDLLQEVAKDRLVVMVTHNPDLAHQYANRIIELRDGTIVSDTNPFHPDAEGKAEHKNMGHSSMSFASAFLLSLNNLRTKAARTILTAFAGSIGIIGIAMILSLSNGVNAYIRNIQEETLSEYPLTIMQTDMDLTALMEQGQSLTMGSGKAEKPDKAQESKILMSMLGGTVSNDLKSFKEYLDGEESQIREYTNSVDYTYNITPNIYRFKNNSYRKLNPDPSFSKFGDSSIISIMSAMRSSMSSFNALPEEKALYESQYEVLAGHWPENYHQCVVVLTADNKITDMNLYMLDLKDNKELDDALEKYARNESVELDSETMEVDIDSFIGILFKLVNVADCYEYDSGHKTYIDKSDNREFMLKVLENAEDMEVVGVVRPREDAGAAMLVPGIAYAKDLDYHVMEQAQNSELVKKQLANPKINVFTGEEFGKDRQLDMSSLFEFDEKAFSDLFKFNGDSFNFENMNLDGIDFSNFGDIDFSSLTSFDNGNLTDAMFDLGLDFSEEKMYALFSRLFEGYMAYMSRDEGIDYSGMSEAVLTYLFSDSAREIIQSHLSDAMLRAAAELPGQEELTAIMLDVMSGYPAFPDDYVEDPESIMTAYLYSFEAQEKLGYYAADLSDRLQALDYSDIAADMAADLYNGYEVYAEENSLPSLSRFADSFYAYMQSEEAQNILTEELFQGSGLDELTTQFNTMMVLAADQITIWITDQMVKVMSAMSDRIAKAISDQVESAMSGMMDSFSIDANKFTDIISFNMDSDSLAELMMSMLAQEASYESNLNTLNYATKDNPYYISIYPKDFDAKQKVTERIDRYNEAMKEAGLDEKVISYTDTVATLMSSVSTIVNTVSYVLVAFVSVSLVVSSIMIGIITYISVLERTKEIGILRAIGASKKNITQVFNAETGIIGLLSGVFGIGITLLLLIPTNYVINHVRNLHVKAMITPQSALLLIALSICLTLIGGLIPSKAAAKKDPVTALRTE